MMAVRVLQVGVDLLGGRQDAAGGHRGRAGTPQVKVLSRVFEPRYECDT
jgi:hypothetical protein